MDDADRPIAKASSDQGMGTLTPDAFEPALFALIADWLPENVTSPIPVLACGMVGARQGWVEAGYRAVPCSPLGSPLARAPVRDPRLTVSIMPGLSQAGPDDVMRGEETQIAGLLRSERDYKGAVCLPGTHSKWALIEDGRVISFRTAMTGELFALLTAHSVLRHTTNSEKWMPETFLAAVGEVMSQPERFAVDLFGIRAGALVSGIDPAHARSRLSGLLIGFELWSMRPFWTGTRVTLIGNGTLARLYKDALALFDVDTTLADTDSLTLAGLRDGLALMDT